MKVFNFSFFLLITIFCIQQLFAGDTLKVMTYNLEGMKPGTDPGTRLINIIEKLKEIGPDIIGLQEINESVYGNGSDNQAKRIADSLTAFFGITYHYYISFTHLSWDNQFREYVGIITKYNVEDEGFFSLVPGIFPRKVVWNLINTPLGNVNFFNTHLSYNSEGVRVQQMQQIISYINSIEQSNPGDATILTGDFNATPNRASIMLLTNTGTDTFYVDTYAEANPGSSGYTFPSDFPNQRIDYVFYKNTGSFSVFDSQIKMDQPYDGNNYCSDHLAVLTRFILAPAGINDKGKQNNPDEIKLFQNYPNPFNPSTNINYRLTEAGDIKLIIYNIAGQKIRTLVDNEQEAGNYSVQWNGRNDSGDKVLSGVYIYSFKANSKTGSFSASRKMVYLK